MKTTYVIDIDGTLAQYQQRLHSAGPEPAREPFAEYQQWLDRIQTKDALLKDAPVPGMQKLIEGLKLVAEDWREDIRVVYLTARAINLKDVTQQWLTKNRFPSFDLYMRRMTDNRENHIFKEELIKSFRSDHVVVIDDDPSGKLADICRTHGWTFLKAVTY